MDRAKRVCAVAALLAGLLLAGCQAPQRLATEPARVLARFPFDPNAPLIVLPVTWDNQQYPFILDTGSSRTVFDASLKRRLGHRILWPRKWKDAAGKTVICEYYETPEASLGSLRLGGWADMVVAIDLSAVNDLARKRVDGILGMSFLRDYAVQIDFEKAAVTFFKSERGVVRPEWGEHVPMGTQWRSQLRHVQSQANGVKATFVLDTGYFQSPQMKSSPFVAQLGPRPFAKAARGMPVGAVEGRSATVSGWQPKAQTCWMLSESMTLGPLAYEDVGFGRGHASLLGLPFFSHHLVTFDFPNHRLYLKRTHDDPPKSIEMRFEKLGLGLRREDGRLLVSTVHPNGPTYAKGVRQNDALVEVDGQDVSSWPLVRLLRLLEQRFKEDTGTITLAFKRDEAIYRIPVPRQHEEPKTNGAN